MWVEPDFSTPRLFFLKLSLFHDLTHLEGGLKTASGKENFSSSYEGALAGALPDVT
jgi:hypothetical protein